MCCPCPSAPGRVYHRPGSDTVRWWAGQQAVVGLSKPRRRAGQWYWNEGGLPGTGQVTGGGEVQGAGWALHPRDHSPAGQSPGCGMSRWDYSLLHMFLCDQGQLPHCSESGRGINNTSPRTAVGSEVPGNM